MGSNIVISKEIENYINNHSLELTPVQKEIISYNDSLGDIKRMQISISQCHFLHLIVKITNIKKILEIGTFTGLSALTMSLSLPSNGKLITLDKNEERNKIAYNFFKKAKQENKIKTIIGLALESISNLKKEKGKTFFWEGVYDNTDINNRETITTELNVFEKFVPELDDNAKKSDIIFLANINPQLQLDVLKQCKNINPDSFVGLDTMDLWINNSTELLNKVISRSNVVLVDQYEASTLTGDNNLKNAGLKILESGAQFAVIKKGEHGALIFNKDYVISIPGYLTNYVKDPTGAGDSYAGAFFGYLDRIGNEYTFDNIFIASVLATVVASYTVQGFGSETLLNIGMNDIYERYEKYLNLIGQNSYMSLDNLKNKLDI